MIVGRRYNDSDPAVERATEAGEDERYETEENDVSTPDLPTAATEADRRESAAWQRGYDYGRGISTPEHEEVTINSWDELRPGDAYVRPGPGFSRIIRRETPVPPTPAPGTVGTATVEYESGLGFEGSAIHGRRNVMAWDGGQFIEAELRHVVRFVRDADTTTLRAEVESWRRAADAAEERITVHLGVEAELARGKDEEAARADAAEARLARVMALLDAPGDDVSCAARDLTTPGCFAHDLAVRIRALVADDEQAPEGEAWPFKPGDVLFASPDDNMTPDALDAAPVGTVVRGVVPGDGAEVRARRAKDGWVFLHNDVWVRSAHLATYYAPLTVQSVPGVGGAA